MANPEEAAQGLWELHFDFRLPADHPGAERGGAISIEGRKGVDYWARARATCARHFTTALGRKFRVAGFTYLSYNDGPSSVRSVADWEVALRNWRATAHERWAATVQGQVGRLLAKLREPELVLEGVSGFWELAAVPRNHTFFSDDVLRALIEALRGETADASTAARVVDACGSALWTLAREQAFTDRLVALGAAEVVLSVDALDKRPLETQSILCGLLKALVGSAGGMEHVTGALALELLLSMSWNGVQLALDTVCFALHEGVRGRRGVTAGRLVRLAVRVAGAGGDVMRPVPLLVQLLHGRYPWRLRRAALGALLYVAADGTCVSLLRNERSFAAVVGAAATAMNVGHHSRQHGLDAEWDVLDDVQRLAAGVLWGMAAQYDGSEPWVTGAALQQMLRLTRCEGRELVLAATAAITHFACHRARVTHRLFGNAVLVPHLHAHIADASSVHRSLAAMALLGDLCSDHAQQQALLRQSFLSAVLRRLLSAGNDPEAHPMRRHAAAAVMQLVTRHAEPRERLEREIAERRAAREAAEAAERKRRARVARARKRARQRAAAAALAAASQGLDLSDDRPAGLSARFKRELELDAGSSIASSLGSSLTSGESSLEDSSLALSSSLVDPAEGSVDPAEEGDELGEEDNEEEEGDEPETEEERAERQLRELYAQDSVASRRDIRDVVAALRIPQLSMLPFLACTVWSLCQVRAYRAQLLAAGAVPALATALSNVVQALAEIHSTTTLESRRTGLRVVRAAVRFAMPTQDKKERSLYRAQVMVTQQQHNAAHRDLAAARELLEADERAAAQRAQEEAELQAMEPRHEDFLTRSFPKTVRKVKPIEWAPSLLPLLSREVMAAELAKEEAKFKKPEPPPEDPPDLYADQRVVWPLARSKGERPPLPRVSAMNELLHTATEAPERDPRAYLKLQLHTMDKSARHELISFTLAALWRLVFADEGRDQFARDEDGVALLVRIIREAPNHTVCQLATSMLWTLCGSLEAKLQAMRLNVIQLLMDIVKSGEHPSPLRLMAAKFFLALSHDEELHASDELKGLIEQANRQMRANEVPSMLSLLGTDDVDAQQHALSVLAHMAVAPDRRAELAAKGGVEVILRVAQRTGSLLVRTKALHVLLNLSAHSESQVDIARRGLEHLIDWARAGESDELRVFAAAILDNCKRHSQNRTRFYKAELRAKRADLSSSAAPDSGSWASSLSPELFEGDSSAMRRSMLPPDSGWSSSLADDEDPSALFRHWEASLNQPAAPASRAMSASASLLAQSRSDGVRLPDLGRALSQSLTSLWAAPETTAAATGCGRHGGEHAACSLSEDSGVRHHRWEPTVQTAEMWDLLHGKIKHQEQAEALHDLRFRTAVTLEHEHHRLVFMPQPHPPEPRRSMAAREAAARAQLGKSKSATTLALSKFRHVEGSQLCADLFDHYELPNGDLVHLYHRSGPYEQAQFVPTPLPPGEPTDIVRDTFHAALPALPPAPQVLHATGPPAPFCPVARPPPRLAGHMVDVPTHDCVGEGCEHYGRLVNNDPMPLLVHEAVERHRALRLEDSGVRCAKCNTGAATVRCEHSACGNRPTCSACSCEQHATRPILHEPRPLHDYEREACGACGGDGSLRCGHALCGQPTCHKHACSIVQPVCAHCGQRPATVECTHSWCASMPNCDACYAELHAAPEEEPEELWIPQQDSRVWKPRMKEADCRDLYVSDRFHRRCFLLDWNRISKKSNIQTLLGKTSPGLAAADALREARDALHSQYNLIMAIFDYLSGTSGAAFDISLNPWNDFVQQCDIVDDQLTTCNQTAVDTMFIVTNLVEDKKAPEQRENPDKTLVRYEFVEIMLRVAIGKFCGAPEGERELSVPQAVAKLLTECVAPHLPPEAREPGNEFRRTLLYTVEVDDALVPHLPTLTAIYERFAPQRVVKGTTKKTMDYSEWMRLLEVAGLIDTAFTKREASIAFSFSRMRVYDDLKSKMRYTTLTFLDFVEALCRCAVAKPMPADEDLAALGVPDVAAFDALVLEGQMEPPDLIAEEPLEVLAPKFFHLLYYRLSRLQQSMEQNDIRLARAVQRGLGLFVSSSSDDDSASDSDSDSDDSSGGDGSGSGTGGDSSSDEEGPSASLAEDDDSDGADGGGGPGGGDEVSSWG